MPTEPRQRVEKNLSAYAYESPHTSLFEIHEPMVDLTLEESIAESDFHGDAIRIRANGVNVSNKTINDQTASFAGHRDGIQLIPENQFSGGMLKDLTIHNNTITSNGALQGVFSSDGIYRNLTISENTISTKGKHWISINGMLSGSIKGNTLIAGEGNRYQPLVKLYPARVGGNPYTFNVWILSFSDPNLEYKRDILSNQPDAEDYRFDLPQDDTPNNIGLKDFDYYLFKREFDDQNLTLEMLHNRDPYLQNKTASWIERTVAYIDQRDPDEDNDELQTQKDYLTLLKRAHADGGEFKRQNFRVFINTGSRNIHFNIKINGLFKGFLMQQVAFKYCNAGETVKDILPTLEYLLPARI